MSSPASPAKPQSRAETAFRAAFERLKLGKPNLIPKGSSVSQNNVAREAGVDPSALKRARFPALVSEIQLWIDTNDVQHHSSLKAAKAEQSRQRRGMREQLESVKAQRDHALALLVEADARILALTGENRALLKKLQRADLVSARRE